MKLVDIIKEGVYGKFWWMDPNGKLIPVTKTDTQSGHRESAIEILKALGKEPGNDVFQQLYDAGWLRIGRVGNEGYYPLEFTTRLGKNPNNQQFRALKDLAIELGSIEIRNGSTKQPYHHYG